MSHSSPVLPVTTIGVFTAVEPFLEEEGEEEKA